MNKRNLALLPSCTLWKYNVHVIRPLCFGIFLRERARIDHYAFLAEAYESYDKDIYFNCLYFNTKQEKVKEETRYRLSPYNLLGSHEVF